MGNVCRFPILQWRLEYGLEAMGETGTGDGTAVIAALEAGYPLVVTVDAYYANRARARIPSSCVHWFTGESVDALPAMLEVVGARRALWWLDAHLPEHYGPAAGFARTPLLAEVGALVNATGSHRGDVFLCDDTRLYGMPADDGQLPEDILPANPRDLEQICALLHPTHRVLHDPRDTGYLVALPRNCSSP